MRRNAKRDLKEQNGRPWERFVSWRGGRRLLTIIDEALANVVDESSATTDNLAYVINLIPPSVRSAFPKQVAVLEQVHQVLLAYADPNGLDNSMSFIWEQNSAIASVDFSPLIAAMSDLPYDRIVYAMSSPKPRADLAVSCHRLEQSRFSLELDCDFQGRHSRFYLRELPGPLNEAFGPREFPPSKYNARAYLDTALRAVVDELDPGMIPRLKFPNWGSNASDDADALFWEEGYLIEDQAGDSENIKKCAFLRVQSYRRGLSAVLFAVSDVDHPSLQDRSSNCGVPGEVTTILGSLGDVFEGGRFWARAKQ